MATKTTSKTPAKKTGAKGAIKPNQAPSKSKPAPKGKVKPRATGKPKPAPRTKAGRATTVKAAPSAMFKKVAFTLFAVEDAARARGFYENVLGLERGLASPDGTWTEYDLPGGGCLALFRHPDPAFARPSGGASIAFEVADLDALNRRLLRAGVSYQGDMVHGPHCRMSNILDSEGNAIILHQLNAD